jgi:4-methyl-5(b-hydroxyethyl)-thiazole monophosphate biosynthesis
MSKVCVFLAEGFEEIEGLTVVDLLRRAQIETEMVSIMSGISIVGSHNITIKADKMFDEADLKEYDMIVLPGGMPGTKHLDEHSGVENALREFDREGKWIAAICAAPSVLGKRGMLAGKKAVCYPGFEDELIGAEVVSDNVVIEKNIITSKGLGTAIDFALCIIRVLSGKEQAEGIASSVQYSVN